MLHPQLGYTYRDLITGFTGIAIGHCSYITGCNQTLLQPIGEKTDVRPESQWFDDQRIQHVETVGPLSLDNGATPGFDKPAPTI